MFVLAGLFVLGKDIKLLRLTPETRDGEAEERGWGRWTKENVRAQLELRRHRNTTVHKLYLLPLLYVNTLYLPNPLRRSKRQPCFMIACNFEIIQSLAQDLGNVLKRSMAFFSRNIKVTKMHGLLFWKYRRKWGSYAHLVYNWMKRFVWRSLRAWKVDLRIVFSVAYLLYGPSPRGHIKAKGVLLLENINPWLTTNCTI